MLLTTPFMPSFGMTCSSPEVGEDWQHLGCNRELLHNTHCHSHQPHPLIVCDIQWAVWSRKRSVYSGNYNIRRVGDDNVTYCAGIRQSQLNVAPGVQTCRGSMARCLGCLLLKRSLWYSVWQSYRTVVCYTTVFSVVTQRSSPLTSGEERCVTTLKTAV